MENAENKAVENTQETKENPVKRWFNAHPVAGKVIKVGGAAGAAYGAVKGVKWLLRKFAEPSDELNETSDFD